MTGPVLHIVPGDLARGGQIIAKNLRDQLDRPGEAHQIVTLFDAAPAVLGSVHHLGVKAGWSRRVGFNPRAARALRRTVRELAPSAIVAHGSEALKYAVPAGGTVPVVYHRFGIATAAARRGWRRRFHRSLVSRAALVVAISDEVMQEVIDLLQIEPTRVVLVPNARDPSIYFPDQQRAAPVVPRLIFVGHLTSTKRPLVFVDMVSELRRRGTAVTATMVGDGPLLAAVIKAAPPDVEVLGARYDVPQLLRTADILVFTSVPESEGLPGVLVEAAMTGLPVVTTRVPGIAQIVVDGVTGLVVDPKDRSALCDAVEHLVLQADRRAAMGLAAREHAVSRFALDQMVAEWHAVVRRVVTSNHS